MTKILLDCCCGPCSTHCIKILSENYDIILYVSNFNVHPREEYEKRLKSLKKYAEIANLPLIIEEYAPKMWFQAIKGYEDSKEGGVRCKICFEFRLKMAAETAKDLNCEIFTTTLSISPHKNYNNINEIGVKIAKEFDLTFLEANFKKKDGFKKSVELSKKYDLYRQDYCGCIYSKKEREK
ncbi:MAG: epoxyqueuosine reductase QueH [Promethearchaeota archaeon]|nr:MAG: epoxyqueuosine reductase QueH [Candidatus Lokiarchaeota archaeon]